MKIFIPSYNRAHLPQLLTTPKLLLTEGVPFKVVVRPSQEAAYLRVLPTENVLTLPAEYELNGAREFTRSLLAEGEWCLQMDDNVRGFIATEPGFYAANDEIKLEPGEKMITRAKWQKTMSVKVTFKQFYDQIVLDTMLEAEDRGANLCGFSAHENPAFRGKKWSDVGYVCGKAMLMRNVGLSWNQTHGSSCEDYALTGAHLYRDGRILINKWGHPTRVHYQPGGCGPYEQRLPFMLAASADLLSRYGEVFGVKNANNPEGRQGEMRVRLRTVEQVAAWRAGLAVDPNQ